MGEPLLFDTDVLIDAGRGVSEAIDTLAAAAPEDRIRISVITEMELFVGCRDEEEWHTFYDFLTPHGAEIFQIHAAIWADALELMRRHQLSPNLRIPDALIAATARWRDCPLITFRPIDDLVLPSYPPPI